MTTTLNHTNNYTLGRGALFFEPFAPGTQIPSGGERFFGDCNAVDFTFKTTDLDHYASTAGVKEIDESIITQVDRSGTFTTEDISVANLALFFLGTTIDSSVVGAAVVAEAVPAAYIGGGVLADRYYQLGETATNQSGNRGLVATTPAVVKIGTTVLVAGTDYIVDYDGGSIYIMPGGAADIPGAPPTLSVDYTTESTTFEHVISGNSQITGKLRFRAANAVGQNRDAVVPYVVLSPNGSFQLVGDKLQSIQFNMKLLLKGSGLAALYVDGRAAGS
jgi:hypothetical protein